MCRCVCVFPPVNTRCSMCVCFIKGVQIWSLGYYFQWLAASGGSSEMEKSRVAYSPRDVHCIWKVVSCFLAIDSMGLDSIAVSTLPVCPEERAFQLFSHWPHYPARAMSLAWTPCDFHLLRAAWPPRPHASAPGAWVGVNAYLSLGLGRLIPHPHPPAKTTCIQWTRNGMWGCVAGCAGLFLLHTGGQESREEETRDAQAPSLRMPSHEQRDSVRTSTNFPNSPSLRSRLDARFEQGNCNFLEFTVYKRFSLVTFKGITILLKPRLFQSLEQSRLSQSQNAPWIQSFNCQAVKELEHELVAKVSPPVRHREA